MNEFGDSDIKQADGFISYEDYLALPYFKEYARENGTAMPPRAKTPTDAEVAVLTGEKAVECDNIACSEGKKSLLNVVALLTIILGLALAVWCVIGCFVKPSGALVSVFATYNGMCIAELAPYVIEYGFASFNEGLIIVSLCIAYVLVLAATIGSAVNITAARTGLVMKIGVLVAFALFLTAAVTEIVSSATVPLGMAIAVLCSLVILFINSLARNGRNKEKNV